ncbi:MAG TPA: hypothetical protein VLH86_03355 [Patescibacteria group bacterium]|nr:hypothetical protein [Patescibacteria group bacterium]
MGSTLGERVAGGWAITQQAAREERARNEQTTQAQGGGSNGSGEQAPQAPRYFEDAAVAGDLALAQIAQVQLAGEMIDA